MLHRARTTDTGRTASCLKCRRGASVNLVSRMQPKQDEATRRDLYGEINRGPSETFGLENAEMTITALPPAGPSGQNRQIFTVGGPNCWLSIESDNEKLHTSQCCRCHASTKMIRCDICTK